MIDDNVALWLRRPGSAMTVGAAAYPRPAPNEVVVRVRAVAVNPVDNLPGYLYPVILPWLRFPAVIGSDVAGVIVEVGHDVTRLRPGDRVLGHALGLERGHVNPAEGAFQHYVVLRQNMLAAIPDTLSFQEAAVLPLGVSTAASGLFQEDHLGLALPADTVTDRGEAVLVWGGSTSVGSSAIQLARNAGYHIVATASAHNFDYVRSLGAAAVADYRSRTVIDDVAEKLGGHVLAGVFAIGAGSVRHRDREPHPRNQARRNRGSRTRHDFATMDGTAAGGPGECRAGHVAQGQHSWSCDLRWLPTGRAGIG